MAYTLHIWKIYETYRCHIFFYQKKYMQLVGHLYETYMENVRQNIFNIDFSCMLDICSVYGTYNRHI